MEAYEESHDNKNVQNTIGIQHENRSRILPALARLIPFLTGTVIPALGVGALSGQASTGVQKLIGNGLYLKKRSGVCRIETDGEWLYLEPVNGDGFESVGNGLYLMKQGGMTVEV